MPATARSSWARHTSSRPSIWRGAGRSTGWPRPARRLPTAGSSTSSWRCAAIGGLPIAPWIQGSILPAAPGSNRDQVITEWDSQFDEVGLYFRSIYTDGSLATAYAPRGRSDGSEGARYDLGEDPLRWHNRWSDLASISRRSDMDPASTTTFRTP